MPVRSLIAAFALVAALVTVSSASAAPTKPFALDVSPASEWAGVTDDAYAVTLTNLTSTQQLGSANVTIPAAFAVVSGPSLGTVAAGNVLQLRNLALPPGGSVTVTLGLRMPCVAGSYQWAVEAKQSNDFSGPPGNSLGPVSGQRTTTVDGSCALRFVDQPAETATGQQIRADDFSGSRLVSVEAIDGRPTGAQRLTWFGGTISLGLGPTTYPGQLSPSTPASAASAGIASFDNLAIDAPGIYSLRATTDASGFAAGDSQSFRIVNAAACTPSTCRVQAGNAALTGTGITDSGLALLTRNLGTQPVCTGYTSPTGEWYEFALTVAGDKTVDTAYDKPAVKAVGSVSALEICFAAPVDFPAKGGTQPFDYDGDGDPSDGHVGLLPDCPATPVTPCVERRSGTSGGGAVVTFAIPAAWGGDPRYS